MGAAEDDHAVDLRIGGWLPPPEPEMSDTAGAADAADVADTQVLHQPAGARHRAAARDREPAYAGAARSSAPAPRQRLAAADTTEIAPVRPVDIGEFVTGPPPADQSRHRRRPRRRVGLAIAATLSVTVGLPLVFGLVGGPDQRAPELLPVPSVTPPDLGPVSLPPLPPSAATTTTPSASPTPSAGRTTHPAPAPSSGRTAKPTVRPLTVPQGGAPSATPSPSPSAQGVAPQTISVEAEGPSAIRSGTAAPRSVGSASGGTVIGMVGNGTDNWLRFDGLDVPAAGPYDLVVHYTSGEQRAVDLAVNGTFVLRVDLGSTGGWETVGTATVRLPMAAGPNTVQFSNAGAFAPDFDRVTLTR